MLVVGRKKDEGFVVVLDEETLEQLLVQTKKEHRPVLVRIGPVLIRPSAVRIGVVAQRNICVLRDEVWEEEHEKLPAFASLAKHKAPDININ